MTLYIIGIGLNDEKDITVKGLEAVRKCDEVFLESYTSILQCNVNDLEKLYGKKVNVSYRSFVEGADELLAKAKKQDIAMLIVGDPLSATTHTDLMMRAHEKKIKTIVVNNASVLNAVGITGLQLYKFGRTTSIPFFDDKYRPETPYNILIENQRIGAHTLMLLDLRPDENKYMTVKEAIGYLLSIEDKRKEKVFTKKTMVVACARLGSGKAVIKYATAEKMSRLDFGKPPYCLIVPGKLHFMEEEFLQSYE